MSTELLLHVAREMKVLVHQGRDLVDVAPDLMDAFERRDINRAQAIADEIGLTFNDRSRSGGLDALRRQVRMRMTAHQIRSRADLDLGAQLAADEELWPSLVAEARSVLGDTAATWWISNALALGGRAPRDVAASSSEGEKHVHDLLGRMAHGVYT